MTAPAARTEFPASTPFDHGLFSAAAMPGAVDRMELGLEWDALLCDAPTFVAHDPCAPAGAGNSSDFTADLEDGGVPEGSGSRFTVYTGFSCKPVGRSMAELDALAQQALALKEQRAVEYAFWTGSEGNTPRLADPSAATLNGGVAVPPAVGLSLLEGWLGQNYHGVGTLHAPREVAAHWSGLHSDGTLPVLTTHLGNRLAYGGGYSQANTSPAGVAAPAGQFWVYATGRVAVWRGEVYTLTPGNASFNRTTNVASFLAARDYVLGRECSHAAVLIDPTP